MLRKGLSLFLLLGLALALVACRRGAPTILPTAVVEQPPGEATGVATLAATSTVATAAVPSTATSTATPAAASITATATPPPGTATPAPPSPTPVVDYGPPPGGSARINFQPGATSATLQSTLAANGDTDTWLLRVMAGQVVTVQTLANPPGLLIVRLGDMGGGTLATNPDTTGVSAAVPVTGDYQINLSTASGAPAVGYTMQVYIPAASGQPVTPKRVQFAPGATSAQLNETLAAGGDIDLFVVRLAAGQGVNVAVFADAPAVTSIFIRDTAGQLISSGTDMTGASATTTVAGDYFIDVSSHGAAPAVNYRLTVTAPPVAPPPAAPTRIQFAPGAMSAQLPDSLAAGGDINQYVVRLAAGQGLSVSVFASIPAVANIYIRDTAGQLIASGTDMSGASATTTVAGDYFIDVTSPGAAPALGYTLTVTAPPVNPPPITPTRIQFPPGASSATLTDTLAAGGDLNRYVLRLAADQMFSVGVFASTPAVTNIFIRDTNGALIASGTDLSGVNARTSVAGDYTIDLATNGAAQAVTYTLTVSATPVAPPPGQPARIQFAPGASSAVVNDSLPGGNELKQYVLQLAAGQSLSVSVFASTPAVTNIFVFGPDGQQIAYGTDMTGAGAITSLAGDHIIWVSTIGAAPAVTYTMTVTAPPSGQPEAPARITFPPGQSSAQLDDRLGARGDINRYVLRLGANQQLRVEVFADVPAVTSIFVRDTAGQNIASGSDMTGANAVTSVAGDYFIDISTTATAPAVSYRLTVIAPPNEPPPPVEPIHIEFGPGQISAQLDGSVAAGLPPVEYLIRLGAGQTLITNANDNPQGNVDVTVRDLDGHVLNFGRSPTSLGTQVLDNGDYIIAMSTMSTAAVGYSLEVVAPPLPRADAARVTFQPGATSATVTGDLPFGGDTDHWVLRALAGQTMNVSLGVNTPGWLQVFIYNEARQLIGLGTDISGASAPLGTNGDYTIVVHSDPAIGPLGYSMVVDVR